MKSLDRNVSAVPRDIEWVEHGGPRDERHIVRHLERVAHSGLHPLRLVPQTTHRHFYGAKRNLLEGESATAVCAREFVQTGDTDVRAGDRCAGRVGDDSAERTLLRKQCFWKREHERDDAPHCNARWRDERAHWWLLRSTAG